MLLKHVTMVLMVAKEDTMDTSLFPTMVTQLVLANFVLGDRMYLIPQVYLLKNQGGHYRICVVINLAVPAMVLQTLLDMGRPNAAVHSWLDLVHPQAYLAVAVITVQYEMSPAAYE